MAWSQSGAITAPGDGEFVTNAASEQPRAVREQVGLACIAWEDANLKAAGKPCFPS